MVEFNANIPEILANAQLTAAMGDDPVHDSEAERHSASIKCHDPSGEIYYVAFSRKQIRISSYSDDSIQAFVEAWVDTVPPSAQTVPLRQRIPNTGCFIVPRLLLDT